MNSKLVLMIVLSFVLYTIISGFGNIQSVDWSGFDFSVLPLVLGIVSVAYLFRFFRWHYLLGEVKVKLRLRDSLLVFLSGFTMSITPSKAGDLIKVFMLKDRVESHKTAPVVVIERFGDALAMAFLCAVGAAGIFDATYVVIALLAACIMFFFVIRWERSFMFIMNLVSKLPFVKKLELPKKEFYASFKKLLSVKATLASFVFGTVAWFLECVSLYLIVGAFGFSIPLTVAVFVFALSSVLGIISLMPGGLGVTEGSMIAILMGYMTMPVAAASTIITRVVTLWYAVLLGLVAYFLYQKK